MACDIRTFGVWQGSFLIPVLLIVSLFCGIYSQSTIPGNPNIVGDFERNEGETVTLSCTSVGGNPLPTVQWYKNTQLVDAGSSANGKGDGVYSIGSTTVTYNNYTFTVSRSDNLVSYICRVQNSLLTNPLSRSWTISIYVPAEQPIITGPQPAITTALDAGSTYKYVCTARNGRPAPNIVWKLGTSLSSSVEFHQGITENTTTNSDSTLSKSSSLSWVPITADNGKSLYCQTDQTQAGGSVLTKSAAVAIVVQQIPIVQIGSPSYIGQVGSSVTLQCSVISATPGVTDVYWRRLINGVYTRITIDNIRFFGSSLSNENLTISNLALSDATSYQCSAVNQAGTGNSGATTLSVTGTLPTVQVGSSTYSSVSGGTVTLVCSIISSNPTATSVFWEKDINGNPTNVRSFMSSRITGGTVAQPSLTISSLTGSDTGRYYCSAGNSVGNGTRSSTDLTVQNRPSISLPQSTYSISYGQDVLLRCIVNSDTTLTSVVWRKYTNGVPSALVVTGSSHYSGGTKDIPSLTIRAVTFLDSGNYDCSATNAAGTSISGQITLTVLGTVPNVNIPQSSYSVSYGGSVTLQCDVNSNPFQNRIEWQRIANGVSTTINVTTEPRYSGSSINAPSLTITGAISSDGGVYVCSATNDAGKGVSGQTLLTVVGNRPSVVVQQTLYSIFVGSNVTMTCIVSGNPAVNNVFWTVTRNGFTNNVPTTGGSRYSNGNKDNPSLTLTNAQQSDTGVFTCKAQNSAGTTDSNPITLTVSGTSPTVSVTQSSYSVFTNNDVTMTCSVSANPAATISWVFSASSGGQTTISSSTTKYTFTASSTSSSLTVRTANSNDQGSYACTATNAVGTNRAVATLVVTGNLPPISMQSTYSVITGSDIVMTCSANANPAVNSYKWLFQSASGGSFVSISSSSKYSINGLSGTSSSLTVRNTAGTDNGRYRCEATNQVGTSTATTSLSVSGSAPTVNIPQNSYSSVTGQDVTLPCSVSATPAASISWTFISTSQSQTQISVSTSKYTFNPTSTDGTLIVRSTTSSDTGTYRCQATNAVGTNTDLATLSVSGSPPSVSFGSSTYSIVTGNNVQLSCFVSATPSARDITWTFQSSSGGGTLTITSSTSGYSISTSSTFTQSTLTVLAAQNNDAGTYTCTATNLVGTRSASASLSVTGSLPAVSIPQNSYTVVTGQDVTIPCSVSATPAASISWTFISTSQSQTQISVSTSKYTFNPTSTDGTLIVRSTTSSDTGTYRCQATNVVGPSSDSATLSVSGSLPSVNIPQSSYSVVTGSNQQISCFVNANPTASAIAWTFRSSTSGSTIPITFSTAGYSITTPSTSQSTLTVIAADNNDEGTYTCQATNQVGNSSDSAFLDVTGSFPTANIQQTSFTSVSGQDVTISCAVSATPSASISWTFIATSNAQTQITTSTAKYSLTTSSTGSTLVIRTSNSGDSGTYRCTATNSIGTASDTATLSVSGSLPLVDIPNTVYTAVTGQDATIPCSVSANPAANSFSWTFISTLSSQTSISQSTSKYSLTTTLTDRTLVVRNTTSADTGTYRCSATNAEGTASDQATLSVSGSVPAVDIPQNSYTAITGNNLVIPCTVSASPAVISVAWRFTSNSGSVVTITASSSKYTLSSSQNFPQLTILSVSQSDSGTYQCSATNSVGTRSDSATVSITGSRPDVAIPSSNYNVVVGNDVTLPCTISASPSATSVSWLFTSNSNDKIQITTSSVKYTVSNVGGFYNLTVKSTTTSDAGVYECRATNIIDTSTDSARLDVTGSAPLVTLQTTNYQQTYGQNITFQCTISATPAVLSVKWQRYVNGNYLDINTLSSTRYFGSDLNNYGLTIVNLIFTDAGQYRCTARNQVGTGVSPNRLTLQVLGSQPTPNIPLGSYSVLIGNNIQIPCFVSADPAVNAVEWRIVSSSGGTTTIKQSTTKYTLASDTSSPNLTVNSAALTDAGTYSCYASNIVGTGFDSATLTISGIIPNVTIPETSLSVQKRQNFTITCEVTDALPKETSVLWEFSTNQGGSGTIISVAANPSKYQGGDVAVPSLTILSVSASDQGYYTCIASNVFGEGRSEQAFLEATGNAATVSVGPSTQSVLQTNTAVIACNIANANPAVIEVKWEKVSSGGTTPIVTTGRFSGSTPDVPDLTITDVQPSDAGTYYCSARNAIGTTRSNTGSTLIVSGSVPSNIQIAGPTSRVLLLGGSLTLQCSGQGEPAPTFTWIFRSSSSEVTEVGTGNTFTINNAQRTNGGTYTCRGTNTLGTLDSQGVAIDVQYAPVDARTDAQKALSVGVGSTVTLVCEVDANPAVSYQWFRSNSLVATSKQYSFSVTSSTLLGAYTCRATNSQGSQDLGFVLSQAAGSTGASTASSGLSTGEIAAIILALLLLILLIIIIIICCLTHGVCGAICGKKKDVKGRVEPKEEKEVYKETQKEVIIPRFHEESIKGKSYREPVRAGSYRSYPARANQYRQPSAVSRKDVDIRVQNGGYRKENDYEIVRYETVPPVTTQLMTESPRPHRLPAISYTYEDVEKKKKRRRKKKKHHHHRRHHEEGEEVGYSPSPGRRRHGYYDDERVIETRRSSSRSPRRYRHEEDEERIIERRSPSTKRRFEENYITEERYSSGDVIQDDGDLRAYNGVVYREAPSRHGSGRYAVHSSERRSRSSGRRDRGSDDEVEVVYGKEYVVEH